jgi:hypothetical protein
MSLQAHETQFAEDGTQTENWTNKLSSYVPVEAGKAQGRGIQEDSMTHQLKQILSKTVTSHPADTVEEVAELAVQEHSAIMGALGEQITKLGTGERALGRKIDQRITSDWQTLPLRFLLQLPGGLEHIRGRLQTALALWIAQFEKAQVLRAWIQWLALIEIKEFHKRTGVYRRQAAVKLLQRFIYRMILALRRRAIHTWYENIRWLIWIERDAASLVIQTVFRQRKGVWTFLALHDAGPIGGPLRDVYLSPFRSGLPFYIPIRIRAERRPPWQAVIRVQAPYRGRKWRRWFVQQKKAAVVVQAAARMWRLQEWYCVYRRAAIMVQAQIRRIPLRKNYVKLAPAVMIMQRNWRANRGRKFHRVMLLAVRRDEEVGMAWPVPIQRAWRRSQLAIIPIQKSHRKRVANIARRNWLAVLKIQKSWYSRTTPEMDGFAAFLHMGVLREMDQDRYVAEDKIDVLFRDKKAIVIQRCIRAYLPYRTARPALIIQTQWRARLARRILTALRKVLIAQRRLHWWGRHVVFRRQKAASKIQFFWWKSAPFRFLKHLQHVALQRQQAWEAAQLATENGAATVIQAVLHGSWTRYWLKRMGAAVQLQRCWRGHQGRILWKQVWFAARKRCAENRVQRAFKHGIFAELNRQRALTAQSSRKIQSRFRGWEYRRTITLRLLEDSLKKKIVIKVQRLWRAHERIRLAKRALGLQRRKVHNPYQEESKMSSIISRAKTDAVVFYDPHNEEAGMALSSWLFRLGCYEYFDGLIAYGIKTIAQIKRIDNKTLEDAGVNDQDARKIIVGKCARPEADDKLQARAILGFAFIEGLEVVQEQFHKFYPDYKTRAAAFSALCEDKWDQLTLLQLQRLFAHYQSPTGAKENVDSIFTYSQQVAEDQRLQIRQSKCLDCYQFALELIVDRFRSAKNGSGRIAGDLQVSLVLSYNSKQKERLAIIQEALDTIDQINDRACSVQTNWRGHAARKMLHAIREKKLLEDLESAYHREKTLNRVRIAWEAERRHAADKAAKWEEEQRVQLVQEGLQWTLRYMWKDDAWDEEKQCTVYYKEQHGHKEESFDRPTFRYEEDRSSQLLLRCIRGYLGRCRARNSRRLNFKGVEYTKKHEIWKEKGPERRRFVTVRLRFSFPRLAADQREPKIDAALELYGKSYHHDTAAEIKKNSLLPSWARPPDANGERLLGIHKAFNDQWQASKLIHKTTLKLEYTKVQMPYGWKAIVDPYTKKKYFFNDITQETSWTEPEYTFDQEYSAGLIERQWRAFLGRRRFKAVVASLNIEEVARVAIKQGSSAAWVGHGLEGMSPAIWLTRMGLSKAIENFASTKKNKITLVNILNLDGAGLGNFDITGEDHHRIDSFPR